MPHRSMGRGIRTRVVGFADLVNSTGSGAPEPVGATAGDDGPALPGASPDVVDGPTADGSSKTVGDEVLFVAVELAGDPAIALDLVDG